MNLKISPYIVQIFEKKTALYLKRRLGLNILRESVLILRKSLKNAVSNLC